MEIVTAKEYKHKPGSVSVNKMNGRDGLYQPLFVWSEWSEILQARFLVVHTKMVNFCA